MSDEAKIRMVEVRCLVGPNPTHRQDKTGCASPANPRSCKSRSSAELDKEGRSIGDSGVWAGCMTDWSDNPCVLIQYGNDGILEIIPSFRPVPAL